MTWSDSLMFAGSSFVLSLLVKATAVTALALIAERAIRSHRASVGHILYVGVFIILLIVPLASLIVPPIAVSAPVNGALSNPDPFVPQDPFQLSATPRPTAGVSSALSASSSGAWRLDISIRVLAGVWLVGALVCLVPVGLGIVRGARLRRHAAGWALGQRLVDDLKSAQRIRRRLVADA